MRKKLTTLTVALAALLVAAPGQAALDQGGGAAPATPAAADGFGWSDAGIGAGIGAVVVATLAAGALARRHQSQTRRVSRPVTQ